MLLYVLYNVETMKVGAYVKSIEKTFKYQEDVNKLRMLAPSFCDATRIGPSYQPVNVTAATSREVL